ncbi:MAG: hypothetical protein AABW88_01165 [Nanoarchaeota archaeon]
MVAVLEALRKTFAPTPVESAVDFVRSYVSQPFWSPGKSYVSQEEHFNTLRNILESAEHVWLLGGDKEFWSHSKTQELLSEKLKSDDFSINGVIPESSKNTFYKFAKDGKSPKIYTIPEEMPVAMAMFKNEFGYRSPKTNMSPAPLFSIFDSTKKSKYKGEAHIPYRAILAPGDIADVYINLMHVIGSLQPKGKELERQLKITGNLEEHIRVNKLFGRIDDL